MRTKKKKKGKKKQKTKNEPTLVLELVKSSDNRKTFPKIICSKNLRSRYECLMVISLFVLDTRVFKRSSRIKDTHDASKEGVWNRWRLGCKLGSFIACL